MKANELRKLSAQEIVEKIAELKAELFNLRFQNATGQLAEPVKIKQTRREIARLKTIQTQLEGAK